MQGKCSGVQGNVEYTICGKWYTVYYIRDVASEEAAGVARFACKVCVLIFKVFVQQTAGQAGMLGSG